MLTWHAIKALPMELMVSRLHIDQPRRGLISAPQHKSGRQTQKEHAPQVPNSRQELILIKSIISKFVNRIWTRCGQDAAAACN